MKNCIMQVVISYAIKYYCWSSYKGGGGFPGGSAVNNPPAMQKTQETQVRSLGQEEPLEEEMATCSSLLALKIPWTEEPGRLQSMVLQRVRHN